MSSDGKLSRVKFQKILMVVTYEVETALEVNSQIQGNGWQELLWNTWEP